MEIVAILFGLLSGLFLLFWFLVLPILLLLRTNGLSKRLAQLEQTLVRLVPPEKTPLPRKMPAVFETPVAAGQIREVPEERAPKRVREQPAMATPRGFDWENWIGRRGLGWVAVLLLLFAVAFFLQHIFQNNMVGPLGRVLIGVVAGLGFTCAGYSYYRRGFVLFSQMVTSAGAVLLYLSTYAAFGFYELLSSDQAAIFFVLITIEIAVLALLYDAMSIALMAVIGGLLTPILLNTGQDLYRSLFLYLGVLNLGVVALLLVRPWPIIGSVALVGTQAIFAAWIPEWYHPEKFAACLWFQGFLLGLYMLPAIASALRRQTASIDALIRLLLNGCLSAVMLHILLWEDYHAWLGSLALILAIVHALLVWFLSIRYPQDTRQMFVVVAIVLSLVAMVFPWQLDVAWIGVGWAVEGALLWWFGLRVRNQPLRIAGAVFLLLALGRLLFVDSPEAHREPFVPILNSYAIPALVIAACIIVTAVVSRYSEVSPQAGASPLTDLPLDRIGKWAAGIAGVLLVWFILSTETWQYFYTQITFSGVPSGMVNELNQRLPQLQYQESQRLQRVAQMALSLVWAGYAGVILAIGFWRRNQALRWTALGLFGLTLAKVILVDMQNLPGYYRVAVFLAMALVLGVAARIYQRTTTLLEAKA